MAADFIAAADKVAGEIAARRLRPGDRLLPQREFAHRHGIAASTASRVYAELARRGLVTGEVGRGTYVRSAPPQPSPPLVEPAVAPVDLELIFPVLPEHESLLAQALARLAASPAFAQALRPVGAGGTAVARDVAARFLARPGWTPIPDAVLFAGNGRQAIAAALAALARPGDRVGVEAMTYPVATSALTAWVSPPCRWRWTTKACCPAPWRPPTVRPRSRPFTCSLACITRLAPPRANAAVPS